MEFDKDDSENHPRRLQSIRKDQADTQSERTRLIEKIDQKLKEYGKETRIE
jgi:hypothetical protein